jgi:hypothetical protein
VPQVRFRNLGLGLESLAEFLMPAGLRRIYGKGHLHYTSIAYAEKARSTWADAFGVYK